MMSFTRRSSKSQSKSKSSKPAPQQLPPSLASELLMMQFVGGGSIERNTKRIMEQQARDIAPTGRTHHHHHSDHHHGSDRRGHDQRRRKLKPTTETRLPLGEAYRDERGNMWWDEHEAAEFKGLLAPTQHESSQGWGVTDDPFGAASHTSTTFSFSSGPRTHVASYPNPNASYPSYADAGVIPYDFQGPHRRRGSLQHQHPSAGFEDSFSPGFGYVPRPLQVDPVLKKKTGMNLRGRARALFGGH
ncbi:hypothetical protein F5050DRAFT_686498 [Lentinula boryana]|uniref:Uncharacterized protein n=1 Tax=Lentinula boryana TaxID=40481 RepID=A0ABQ8Q4H3_9AGAR|nr:hypothetical protein F5050DRAFT_686498 [Lentinula boryana]